MKKYYFTTESTLLVGDLFWSGTSLLVVQAASEADAIQYVDTLYPESYNGIYTEEQIGALTPTDLATMFPGGVIDISNYIV